MAETPTPKEPPIWLTLLKWCGAIIALSLIVAKILGNK